MSMAVREIEERNTNVTPTAARINEDQPRVIRRRCTSSSIPQVSLYVVQCNICRKWRRVHTPEKYEEIREHLLEQPFICDNGKEWVPEMSCNQPSDIRQDDESLVWFMDRPSIPRPPPRWKRILRLRSEHCKKPKLADVYYVTPTGTKLRSMVKVRQYLDKNRKGGVDISRFSFRIPRKPKKKHTRKRSAAAADADWTAETGETSAVNPGPSVVETRAARAKRRRESRRTEF